MGTRHGETVPVRLHDELDPETGERCMVNRCDNGGISMATHGATRRSPSNPSTQTLALSS